MFTIDLLKGNGIPQKVSPTKTALKVVPFLIPAFIAVVMFVQYRYNNTVMAMGKANIDKFETKVADLADVTARYEKYIAETAAAKKQMIDVTKALSRHGQWTDVIRTLVEELPKSIAIKQLDLKRSTTKKRTVDPNDKEKMITVSLIKRTLIIVVYGNPSAQTDQAVHEYLNKLNGSKNFSSIIDVIRIASQQEERFDDKNNAVYEIECVLKTQE